MVSSGMAFFLWGLAIVFVVIILPSLLGSFAERFQSPGLNKEKSDDHRRKTAKETENNEIERARMKLLYRS